MFQPLRKVFESLGRIKSRFEMPIYNSVPELAEYFVNNDLEDIDNVRHYFIGH